MEYFNAITSVQIFLGIHKYHFPALAPSFQDVLGEILRSHSLRQPVKKRPLVETSQSDNQELFLNLVS
jgi:hypothetical protein